MAAEKVYIIGIGDDGVNGLTEAARRLIERAQLVIGDEHTLSLVPPASDVERLVVQDDFDVAVERVLRSPEQRIVVLASGDPLFYGIARYTCERISKDRIEVLPHVSSMQLAFARVKESWEDAYLTNLATRPLENVIEKIRVADKVGLFTSESCTPADLAGALLHEGIDYFFGYICENLGSPDERVTQAELDEITELQFDPLNVMILVRKPQVPDRPTEAIGQRLFGNPDEAFQQLTPKSGLMTPAEVRAIALAQMDLGAESTVWDIGAGSGSLAIEAAGIARAGKTYAIEMDPDYHRLLVSNIEQFGVTNIEPVLGRAPEAWADLPNPDAIFAEGSGREIARLLELAYERLRLGGRLVANVGSIENVAAVQEALHRKQLDVKIWMINIARGNYQLERVRFEPLRPTFLVAVVKPS